MDWSGLAWSVLCPMLWLASFLPRVTHFSPRVGQPTVGAGRWTLTKPLPRNRPTHGSESRRAVGVFLRAKGPPTDSRARDPTLRPDRSSRQPLAETKNRPPRKPGPCAKHTFYLFLVRGSLSLKRDNNGLRVNVVDGTVVGISLPYTVGKLWNLASMCMPCTCLLYTSDAADE